MKRSFQRFPAEFIEGEKQLCLNSSICGGLNIFRLESLEGGDVDVRHEGVELVHGVLVLVPQAGKADSNTEWNAPENNRSGCNSNSKCTDHSSFNTRLVNFDNTKDHQHSLDNTVRTY